MTLREIVRAGAARFDRRPRYRASIEARAELEEAPSPDGTHAALTGLLRWAWRTVVGALVLAVFIWVSYCG